MHLRLGDGFGEGGKGGLAPVAMTDGWWYREVIKISAPASDGMHSDDGHHDYRIILD